MRIIDLENNGRHDAAELEYDNLFRKFPDNQKIKNKRSEFYKNKEVSKLLHEAERLFWEEKNYKKALEKYHDAYKIRPDVLIAKNIQKCEAKSYAKHKKGLFQKLWAIRRQVASLIIVAIIVWIICLLLKYPP